MPAEPVALDDADDRKLVTLARATRARTGAAEGSCVRDTDGRTYAGASVSLPSLQLSAAQVAVAMAVASGSRGAEAVVLLGEAGQAAEDDVAAIRDFAGEGIPVYLADARGTVHTRLTT